MKNVDLSIEEKWKDIKNYEGLYQISNLEWCTLQYNCNYGSRNYRCTRHRQHRVQQYNKQNDLLGEYLSLKEAEKITKVKYQQISSCCRNKQKSAGGYIWKYC